MEPNIQLPEIKAPKISFENIPLRIKNKLKEYRRVLRITKKPSSEEFKTIVKASGAGIIIIGLIGFIIQLIVQYIKV